MDKLSDIDTSPWYTIIMPSTGKQTTYRPFCVREERALLTAQESKEPGVMLNTLESIVRACVKKTQTNLTTFDIEYLFLHIRAKSVGELSNITAKCTSCKKENNISIDVTSAHVTNLDIKKTIKLGKSLTLEMRYPSIGDIAEIVSNTEDADLHAIRSSIETIYFGDKVYHTVDAEAGDIIEFLLNRSEAEMNKIEEFINNIPTVELPIKYKCTHCEEENSFKVANLSDFF